MLIHLADSVFQNPLQDLDLGLGWLRLTVETLANLKHDRIDNFHPRGCSAVAGEGALKVQLCFSCFADVLHTQKGEQQANLDVS